MQTHGRKTQRGDGADKNPDAESSTDRRKDREERHAGAKPEAQEADGVQIAGRQEPVNRARQMDGQKGRKRIDREKYARR